MSAFVLIPGAGGAAWYWHRVVPELRARGHDAVAVDLPGADQSSGLPEYTDAVVAAIGDRDDVVLVAQSLGAFTAPMVCARVPVGLLVLVNAMVPLPGETPGQWWDNTGWEAARVAAAEKGGYPVEFDLATYFLHDVPAEVAAAGAGQERPEAEVVFGQPCAIDRWRTSPHMCSPQPRTGSSPWNSSAEWPTTGSACPPTRSPAGTWLPCRARSRSWSD
ncbi:alpha/beta hydrolase [Streptomyces luteolifulvus]|uniref:alpha/beta hydrolase n=1 Tax=Streptomyces luteolifulvus TaxID=2615112 RepID=UPI001CD9D84A|nr:alpha/beta fold hydrolase [Streptomyces luteolifulvus]